MVNETTSISAGGVVLRKVGEKWLIALEQQEKYKEKNIWFLPKGHVEIGEDFETAARREILEEVGVSQLQLVEYLGEKERISNVKKIHKIIHYFLFLTNQVELYPSATDKVHVGKWFDLFDPALRTVYEEQNQIIDLVREKVKNSEL